MRLLEFDTANSGANPQTVILTQKPAKKPAVKPASDQRTDTAGEQTGQVFPIHGDQAVSEPVRRRPIDLEQLQQRIEVLERRLQARARNEGTRLPVKDLQQLKQRMKLLERSVHNELWAAKQREHTLLELLARPPLKMLIHKHAKRLATHSLPAAGRWFKAAGQAWWQDHQPLWWPQFARAWQESLDQARGIHPH